MSDDLIDISRALGRIEGKLDAVAVSQITHAKDDIAVQTSLANRLTALEQTKWTAHGFSAGVGAVVSFVITGLGFIFYGHK